MTQFGTAKIHLRNNATGEVRIVKDEYWHGDSQWEEGNYSCDCNRYLFFERANGGNPSFDEFECSDGKYDVLRVELPDGTDHPDPSVFNHDFN